MDTEEQPYRYLLDEWVKTRISAAKQRELSLREPFLAGDVTHPNTVAWNIYQRSGGSGWTPAGSKADDSEADLAIRRAKVIGYRLALEDVHAIISGGTPREFLVGLATQ